MPILIRCSCGQRIRGKEEHEGKFGRCPRCGKKLRLTGKRVPAYDLFLSYSSKDKTTADALCATLEARGFRCWIAPRDLLPGAEWGAAIIDAIEHSRALVLVFSSHANASHQVKREIERAVAKGLVILPFRIEDVPPSGALEYFISSQHWLDALTPPLEKHLGELADRVQSLLSEKAASGGASPGARPWRPSPFAIPSRTPWRFLLVGGATLFLALLLVLALVAFRGGPPTAPQPNVSPPAELLQAKADALAGWEGVRALDRGQGFGSRIDEIDAGVRAADALSQRGANTEATLAYRDAAGKAKTLQDAELLRRPAAESRGLAEQARQAGLEITGAKEESSWSEAEQQTQEGRVAFEKADFAASRSYWQSASGGYEQSGKKATQAKQIAEAARSDFNDELDDYDLNDLAQDAEFFKQLGAFQDGAEADLKSGRFKPAAKKFEDALHLLVSANPLQIKLQKKLSEDFSDIDMQFVLDYLKEVTGVPIVANWKALKGKNVANTQMVAVKAKGLSAGASLRLTLQSLSDDVDFIARSGRFLYVSTKEDIAALRKLEQERRRRPRIPRDGAVREKMAAKITDGKLEGAFFEEELQYIAEKSGIKVVLRWEVLDKIDVVKEKARDVPLDVSGLSCGQALWVILATTDSRLDYALIDGDVLLISTAENLEASKAGK